jgi:outer membrane protein assembly factor BamE
MRPAHFKSALRLSLGLAALSVLLGGCVYRIPIQQGNYIDGTAVRQLKVGMTRSQVRYLLGTPMIKDPFDVDRWDFVYYYKHGYFSRPYESRVTVFFKNGKVSHFALYHVPKGQPLIPGLPSS